VRSLLRLADSEQYRCKLALRAAATARAAASPPSPRADRRLSRSRRFTTLATDSLLSPTVPHDSAGAADLNAVDPDAVDPDDADVPAAPGASDVVETVEQRLARASDSISRRAGAVAWWISLVNETAGTIRTVSCGITRAEHMTDGLWPSVEVDPTVYDLSDFPTTIQALQGGAFHVDTLTGDAAERRLLIQLGFQAMIAAGGTDDEGRGWLVEIYGDSLTPDLHAFTDELDQAAQRAIAGPAGA